MLWDRAMIKEQNEGTYIVHANNAGSIIVAPGDTGSIATGNLTGCTAAGVILFAAGYREAYMQHFNQTNRDEGTDALRNFVAERGGKFEQSHSVILSPGGGVYSCEEVVEGRVNSYFPEDVNILTSIIGGISAGKQSIRKLAYPNLVTTPHYLKIALPKDGYANISIGKISRGF